MNGKPKWWRSQEYREWLASWRIFSWPRGLDPALDEEFRYIVACERNAIRREECPRAALN